MKNKLPCTERKAWLHVSKGDFPGRVRESEKKRINIPGKVFYLFREFVSEKSTSVSFPNREKLNCESELFQHCSITLHTNKDKTSTF